MPRKTFMALAALSLLAVPARASTKASTRHYLRALLLQHQGDFAAALQEYEAASQLDPQSSYILSQAAELALETGQPDKAMDFAQRLVAIEPRNPKPRILLGQVRWARGETAEAQKAFEAALKIEPKSSEAMFALGHLLMAQSPENAKRYFERYLATNPSNEAEAHYQIALVDQRQGMLDDAILHLKAVIELQPENPQGRFSLAQVFELKKDTEAALGEYQRLLDMEPEDLGLLEHVGELYFFKGDLSGAEARFQKAKALSPRHPGACLWLALLAERRGDFAAAARSLQDSSALGQDAELSLRLSYYLTQANRLEDSIKVLEEAHAKWPETADLAYFLALGYGDLKRYDRAVSLLQEVLGKNPDSRDARFQLAAIYEKLDRLADMEREFKTLLEKSPTDAVALNYLGYSLADRGVELPAAQELARRAVALDPGNGAYRDTLGWVYFKEKDYARALEELRRAVESLPDDPTVWDHLGDAFAGMKDPSSAWEAWKTSAVNDPENKKVLKKISEAERSWSSRELGERLLALLARRRGSLAGFAGFCRVSASAGDKTVLLTGLMAYKAPGDLSLDILGPLLIPMFHARLSAEGPFAMDSIPADGLPPEAFRQILERSFLLLRDYLSGAVFAERPADYHNGWRTRWIATSRHQLFLDDSKGRVQGVQSEEGAPARLSLDDFRTVAGRQVPAFFKLEGRGFAASFQLQDPKISFQDSAAAAGP